MSSVELQNNVVNELNKKYKKDSDYLIDILNYPHLLGHLAGKTKLTELHSFMIHYLWNNEKSASLQAHRGSYKTTAVGIIGPIWWLLYHPTDRIALCRKTFTDAARVVRSIEKIMTMPEVQYLYYLAHGFKPKFQTKKFGELSFNFKSVITPEASITAHGLDYGFTGKHYDKILFDDFETLKDRISKAERTKTIEIIREVQTNVIEHGKPTMFDGTPWHKHGGWNECPKPLKFDVYKCGILSEKEIEEKKKSTTNVLFAANYLLKHVLDEDVLFGDPYYERWRHSLVGVKGHLDAAFDGNNTNALTFLAKKSDNRLQGIGFSYKGNVKDWTKAIVDKYKEFRCRVLYIETNADQGFTADKLKAEGLNVITYSENQNKHNKITTYLYDRWKYIDWDERTDPEYLLQIVDYSEGEDLDDAPDSVASLIREAFHSVNKNDNLWRM